MWITYQQPLNEWLRTDTFPDHVEIQFGGLERCMRLNSITCLPEPSQEGLKEDTR